MKHFKTNVKHVLPFLKKMANPDSRDREIMMDGEGLKTVRTMVLGSGILFLALFAGGTALGQSAPNATLSDTGILQLPTNVQLSGSYYFDLSQYQFSSDDEMTDFLSDKSADDYVIRALPHLHKGILMLSSQNHPSWTIADWNVYLNAQSTLNPILPGAPNQTSNN